MLELKIFFFQASFTGVPEKGSPPCYGGFLTILMLCNFFSSASSCSIGKIALNIARGTTDPGYWVHNSNHPNSRSMLIVESTLLTWSALFDLFFAFEYFYKTQEVVFLVFLYPLISLNQNVICHWG